VLSAMVSVLGVNGFTDLSSFLIQYVLSHR
jgi:hypothetical protein